MRESRIYFPEFPSYISAFLQITESDVMANEGGSVKVRVHSEVHKNDRPMLPTSWTLGAYLKYPNQFRSQIKSQIINRYGLTLNPETWS
jgi:hypothetical protein